MSNVRFSRSALAAGAALLVLGATLTAPTTASAADLGVVTTEAGLISAIGIANMVNDPDTITLGGAGFTLTGDLPHITQPLTITGAGPGFTLTAGAHNAFVVVNSSLTLSGFTLVGMATPGANFGIGSLASDLTVNSMAVSGFRYGIHYAVGHLQVSQSSFANNRDAAIGVEHSAAASATITTSTFTGNGTAVDALVKGSGSLVIEGNASTDDSTGFEVVARNSASVMVKNNTVTRSDFPSFFAEARGDSKITILSNTATSASAVTFMLAALDGGTIVGDGNTARTGTHTGFELRADNGSTIDFANATATGNSTAYGEGLSAIASRQSTITVKGLTANGNEDTGLWAQASGLSQISILDSTITNSHYGMGVESTSDSTAVVTNVSVTHHEERGAQFVADTAGTIDVTSSLFAHNGDGGIEITAGAVDASASSFDMRDSTIRDNGVFDTHGGGVNVHYPDSMAIRIASTTISGNEADFGGGLYGEFDDSSQLNLTITNSTVSGNTASTGGGIYLDAYNDSIDSLFTLSHSTIVNNTTELYGSGAVHLAGISTYAIRNSILAGSIMDPGHTDATEGDFSLYGSAVGTIDHSIVQAAHSTVAAPLAAGTGNITGQAAKLGPLANNGGTTLTHLPLDGSPAINRGEPGYSGLTTDQRGANRLVGVLDIGAVEVQPAIAATGTDATGTLWASAILLALGGVILASTRTLTSSRRRHDTAR